MPDTGEQTSPRAQQLVSRGRPRPPVQPSEDSSLAHEVFKGLDIIVPLDIQMRDPEETASVAGLLAASSLCGAFGRHPLPGSGSRGTGPQRVLVIHSQA